MTYVETCPAGRYLCPSSLNYGCCLSGMGCALSACYSTAPSTYVFTETITTTDDSSNTITTTSITSTVVTPTAPTDLPIDTSSGLPKFIPVTQPKLSAEVVDSGNSTGGLSKADLGGIIGGALALLIIVVTLALFIMRRLHRTAKAVEESRKGSTQTGTRTQAHTGMSQIQPTASQIDEMERDELLVASPGTQTGRMRSDSDISGSQRPTPSPYKPNFGDPRHYSLDSARDTGEYFDVDPSNPGRDLVRDSFDGAGATPDWHYQRHEHGRNYSDASQLSDGEAGLGTIAGRGAYLVPAELDPGNSTTPELEGSDSESGRVVSSSRTSGMYRRNMSPTRPPLAHHRRRSSGYSSPGDVDDGPSPYQQQQLDVVSESVEMLHGYYGNPQTAVGQTNAGLDGEANDLSSPIAHDFSHSSG